MYPMRPFIFKKVINLFRSFDGNLPELLHQLAQFQSGLACAGTCGFVIFFYLGFSIFSKQGMSQRYKKISISNFFAPKKQRNHKIA